MLECGKTVSVDALVSFSKSITNIEGLTPRSLSLYQPIVGIGGFIWQKGKH
jgi:hypothetical protein